MPNDITPDDLSALTLKPHVSDTNLRLLRFNQEHGWFQKISQGTIEVCYGLEVIFDPRSIRLGYMTAVQEGGRRKNIYELAGPADKPIDKMDIGVIPNSNGWSPEAQIRGAFTNDAYDDPPEKPEHFLISASTRSYIEAIYEVVEMVKDDVKTNNKIRFPVVSLETRDHPDKPIRVPHFDLTKWTDSFPN